MSDVIRKHLDAIAASLALIGAQVDAARHALTIAQPVTQPPAKRPARCEGIPVAHCGAVTEDARIARGTFGDPTAVTCSGCGEACDEATLLALTT